MHLRNYFVASLGRFGFRTSRSIRGWRRQQYRQPAVDRMAGCVRTTRLRFRRNHRCNNLSIELQKQNQLQHRQALIMRINSNANFVNGIAILSQNTVTNGSTLN